MSTLKQAVSETQTGAKAHETHNAILRKGLSKKLIENFNYHPAILPASRKLGKTNPHYGDNTAHFMPIIHYLEPHLKWLDISQIALAGDEEMTEQCSICELIGPDGLLIADTFRVGLMLVMPQTVFPAQYDDATESPFVLSGKLVHQQPGHKELILQAGTTLFHDSFDIHEMRTQNQPLLAVYAWTGEISSAPLLALSCL